MKSTAQGNSIWTFFVGLVAGMFLTTSMPSNSGRPALKTNAPEEKIMIPEPDRPVHALHPTLQEALLEKDPARCRSWRYTERESLESVHQLLMAEPNCRDMVPDIVHSSKVFPGGKVDGWMTPKEMCTLHRLAFWSPGPVGEQGSHVGKSTVAIARGILLSNVSKEFVTADIFPAGIIAEKDRDMPLNKYTPWFHVYSRDKKSVVQMNKGFKTAEMGVQTWERRSMYYEAKGGLQSWLVAHLHEQNLLEKVVIVKADRLPDIGYRFVFIDVAHDVGIIRHNFWAWNRLIRDKHPITFAAHDTVPANRKEFERLFPVMDYSFQSDSLFVFQVSEPGQCGEECPHKPV